MDERGCILELLQACDYGIPCSGKECPSCNYLAVETGNAARVIGNERDSIDVVWRGYIERCCKSESCVPSKRIRADSQGTIARVRACWECATKPMSLRPPAEVEMSVLEGVVEARIFSERIQTTNESEKVGGLICERCGRWNREIAAFGDMPRLALVRSRDRPEAWWGHAAAALVCEDGRCSPGVENTFLGSCLFLPNPGYASRRQCTVTRMGTVYDLRVSGGESNEVSYVVETQTDSGNVSRHVGSTTAESTVVCSISALSFCIEETRPSLTEILQERHGIFKLIKAITQAPLSIHWGESEHRIPTSERLLSVNRVEEPKPRAGHGSKSAGNELHGDTSCDDDESETSSTEGSINTSGSSFNESEATSVWIESDLYERRSSRQTFTDDTIPFLEFTAEQFARDYAKPERAESYWSDDAQAISTDEAIRSLEDESFDFYCAGLHEKGGWKRIEMCTSHEHPGYENLHLDLSVDIDSIDIVSIAMGSSCFKNSRSNILVTWNPYFRDAKSLLRKNNNLAKFDLGGGSLSLYPGRYFNDKIVALRSYHPSTEVESGASSTSDEPISVKVLNVENAMSEFASVSAIVPSACVKAARAGDGALIRAFYKRVFCSLDTENAPAQRGRDQYSEDTWVSKLFWYLITEALLLFSSIVTTSGRDMTTISRMPCCAIPIRQNRRSHDRQQGHDSSFKEGVPLSEGELTITLLYMARYFCALEDICVVPQSQRAFPRRLIAKKEYRALYRMDPSFVSMAASAEIEQMLARDIGSSQCHEEVWRLCHKTVCSPEVGSFISLQVDGIRCGKNAYPCADSNRLLGQGSVLCAQDLLLIAPIVFRMTIHGAKRKIRSSIFLDSWRVRMAELLDPKCLCDGVMDIGYTLNAPKFRDSEDYSVLLKMVTARDKYPLLPLGSFRKAVHTIGPSIFGASGYPDVGGFASRKGIVGDPHSILCERSDECCVRRTKAYSTRRRADSTRGKSIYGGTGVQLTQLLNRTTGKTVCDWMTLEPTFAGTDEQNQALQVEESISAGFSRIYHDITRREQHLNANQNGLGVRFEVTVSLDQDMAGLLYARRILSMQEEARCKRPSWTSELGTGYGKNMESPWWCDFGPDDVGTLPVYLCRNRTFMKLSLAIEKGLMKEAVSAYYAAQQFVSTMNGVPSSLVTRPWIFTELTSRMSDMCFANIALVMARGFFTAAKHQVESLTCRERDLSFHLPPHAMALCGLDASWYTGGVPRLVLSRLLAVEPRFASAVRNTEFQNPALNDLCNSLRVCGISKAAVSSDRALPRRFRFLEALKRRGFLSKTIGDYRGLLELETSEVTVNELCSVVRKYQDLASAVHNESENSGDAIGMSANEVMELSAVLLEPAFCASRIIAEEAREGEEDGIGWEDGKKALLSCACGIAALLVTDVMRSLQKRFDFKEDETALVRVYKARLARKLDATGISKLRRCIENGTMWHSTHRTDSGECGDSLLQPDVQYEVNCLKSAFQNCTVDSFGIAQAIYHRDCGINERGMMPVGDFIETIWKHASSLKDTALLVCQTMRRDGDSGRELWRSVVMLRCMETLIQREDCRFRENYGRTKESRTQTAFRTSFGRILARTFRAAGLDRIAPRLLLNSAEPGVEVWGLNPMFTRLDFEASRSNMRGLRLRRSNQEFGPGIHGLSQEMRVDTNIGRMMISAWVTEQIGKLAHYRHEFERLEENHASSTGNDEKEAFRDEYIRKSKRCLEECPILRMITSYLSHVWELSRARGSARREELAWAIEVAASLVSIRERCEGDEGSAAYEIRDYESTALAMRSVRTRDPLGSWETRTEQECFPHLYSVLKRPWAGVYPNADKLGKKGRMRGASLLLRDTGIFFKAESTTRKKFERKVSPGLGLSPVRTLIVHEFYNKYREEGDLGVYSQFQWRLVPTRMLVCTLMNYMNSEGLEQTFGGSESTT
jgi:hypothetical protein